VLKGFFERRLNVVRSPFLARQCQRIGNSSHHQQSRAKDLVLWAWSFGINTALVLVFSVQDYYLGRSEGSHPNFWRILLPGLVSFWIYAALTPAGPFALLELSHPAEAILLAPVSSFRGEFTFYDTSM